MEKIWSAILSSFLFTSAAKKNSEKSFPGLSLIHLQGFAKVRQLVEQGLKIFWNALQHADRDRVAVGNSVMHWMVPKKRWPSLGISRATWLLVESSFFLQHTLFRRKQPKSPPHHCFTPSPAVFPTTHRQLLFLPFDQRVYVGKYVGGSLKEEIRCGQMAQKTPQNPTAPPS